MQTAEQKEEKSLEEIFARLDEITKSLENPQTRLEDAFALYKEGSSLLKTAGEKIDFVDRQVQEIADDGSLKDFH